MLVAEKSVTTNSLPIFAAVHAKQLAENVGAAAEAAVVPHDQEVPGLQADDAGHGGRVMCADVLTWNSPPPLIAPVTW